MPLYNYQCQECNAVFEKFSSYDDRKVDVDCRCCSGRASYIMSAPALRAWLDSDRWVKNREQVMRQEQKCLKEHGTYK